MPPRADDSGGLVSDHLVSPGRLPSLRSGIDTLGRCKSGEREGPGNAPALGPSQSKRGAVPRVQHDDSPKGQAAEALSAQSSA